MWFESPNGLVLGSERFLEAFYLEKGLIMCSFMPSYLVRGVMLRVVLSSIVLVATTAFAGTERTIDGVLQVENGAAPTGGRETWQLEELWRVGGEDEDMIFGQIVEAVADSEGNVYLLDAQLCHVQAFSPRGEHIGTLSREGEGPGEMSTPADLLVLPSGNLGIVRTFPGKLIKITTDGTPVGTALVGAKDPTKGGFIACFRGACMGSNLILCGARSNMTGSEQSRVWYADRFDEDGRVVASCFEMTSVVDFTHLELVEQDLVVWGAVSAAPGPSGRVFVAPDHNRYAITVYGPAGTVNRIIERQFENRRRTDHERALLHAVFRSWARGSTAETTVKIEDCPPAVTSMHVTADGDLWVQHSKSGRDQADGIMLTYDVFDKDGHFTKQVAISCQGDPDNDRLIWLSDDTVLLVTDLMGAFFGNMADGALDLEEEDAGAMAQEVIYYRVRN